MAGGGGIDARDPAPGRGARVVTTTDEHAGERLDRVLAALLPEFSRSKLRRSIDAGDVSVDGSIVTKASLLMEAGQRVRVALPPVSPPSTPRPQPLDLVVVHEDDDLVVIDKPAGLVVHSGAGEHAATLVDGLLYRYGDSLSRCGGADRPGIVHRLDKGTSGVIVVARTDEAHASLAAQFAERTVRKEYLAVVYGCPKEREGFIDLALGRDRTDRTRISANTDRPRDARSRWRVAEDLGGFALLRVFPETGRMHQVRAHLAALHHPCVGDDKYAGAQWKSVPDPHVRKAVRAFDRPALHAHMLELAHPRTGVRMTFTSPLPADLLALLAVLRRA